MSFTVWKWERIKDLSGKILQWRKGDANDKEKLSGFPLQINLLIYSAYERIRDGLVRTNIKLLTGQPRDRVSISSKKKVNNSIRVTGHGGL
jgi:hypothetical protein